MQEERDYELKQVEVRLKLTDGKPLYSNSPISSPDVAVDVMRKALSEMDREYCCVVNMDTHNRPINFNVVSIGSIDKTSFSMSNVFKSAILSNAASVMMFHNHPSGDLTPSRFDLIATSKLIEAGQLLDIHVEDHIIVAGNTAQFYSMKQNHKGMFEHTEHIHQATGQEPTMRLAEAPKRVFMNVMQYAKNNNVDVHVINGYISAHREDFRGHIAKDKKGAALDEWAIDKVSRYIESRPQKGARFTMYAEGVNKMQTNLLEKDIQEKDNDVSFGTVEMDVDIPDYSEDGTDDRMSVTSSMPSRNNKKSKVTGSHNYKVPHKKPQQKEDKLHEVAKHELDKVELKSPEIKAPEKEDFEMER